MEQSKESMISRRLAIEHEIDKLTSECAKMYLNIIMNPDAHVDTCMLAYDAKRNELAVLNTDLILVCHIIYEMK